MDRVLRARPSPRQVLGDERVDAGLVRGRAGAPDRLLEDDRLQHGHPLRIGRKAQIAGVAARPVSRSTASDTTSQRRSRIEANMLVYA